MEKKLFVVIGSLNVGGTERHLLNILPKLAQYGWDITVFTLSKPGVLAPDLEKQGVRVQAVLSLKLFKMLDRLPRWPSRLVRISLCITRLASLLRKAEIEHYKQNQNKNDKNSNNKNKNNNNKVKKILLHFYLPESYVLGMLAAAISSFSGYKIMSRRSLNEYQSRRPGVAWCEKRLHTKTTLILGNSQAILSELHQKEKVPVEHLRLIYNGLDIKPFMQSIALFSLLDRDSLKQSLTIPKDALVFIKVANLIHYKGHSDLLKALATIKNKLQKPWRILCVGRDDGIGAALKKEAEQLGITENVLWLGSRSDIIHLLSISNIGILCSHEEGFSNAILEGMAAGLPMVVTDVGGNKEAVIQGETGFVVPPKSIQALSDAILTLAEDPDKAFQFGKASQKRVIDHFSLETCVDHYLNLYNALLNHEPLPGYPAFLERKPCAV